MAKLTFSGGIHPYDGKEMSKDIPIKEVYPVSELVFPLSQHIGAPAKAIVAKGDYVLAGQKIAEADACRIEHIISVSTFRGIKNYMKSNP